MNEETTYDFHAAEQKWRPIWEQMDLYRTGADPRKPNYYVLDFFPYPSGAGLSVGHGRNYVPTCVDARFHRMRGFNVLHPMGWDAFGLPAENYAIQHGIHPRQSTRLFTDNYRRQMQLLACSYDWSREINSTDPDYYRWTQWFFLLLFRRGLAVQVEAEQWWCAHCQTILANEQVAAGACWRCHQPVTRKAMRQWVFRITAYADRLLADLEQIDWPESIKAMQRHWIGRTEGAEITFQLPAPDGRTIDVFTTRPDTLPGVTFLALAPEHSLVADIVTPDRAAAVQAYVAAARRQTEIARQSTEKMQTGVDTGATAVHPLTGAPVPIWVCDYVLPGYGTGAVMGVPGHDARDHAFARREGLPVVTVVAPPGAPDAPPPDEAAVHTGPGVMVNAGAYSGLSSTAAGKRIVADLAARRLGRPAVTTRMRDWLISRQRYWGAPIPIVHCPACGPVPLPESALPLLLPDVADFAPAGDGRSPLSRAAAWVATTCPDCGGPARRETDTMDGFVCSSWYFLRFASPHYQDGPFDPGAMRAWLPVDTYVGGAEHAVMHLLYARFFTKVMHDAGLVPFTEPFAHLKNQGVLRAASDGQRMSKSRGNVVTPDEVVAQHGVDATRATILFLGPFDGDVTWDERGIVGVRRFLDRFWRLAVEKAAPGAAAAGVGDAPGDAGLAQARHRIVQRVTADLAAYRFNTAVAALMSYLNTLIARAAVAAPPAQWRRAVETMALLLAPICPFIAEEVWQGVLGHRESVHRQPWPTYDADVAAADTVTVVVQVNGRLRDRLRAPADAGEATLQEMAVASSAVQRHINGRAIRDVIVVPPRLVNIVV